MRFKDLSMLQIALGLSVLAHAVLLTVRFVPAGTFDRVLREMPLDIILVNTRTRDRPDQPTAIAQASLAGGGDLDKGRATSMLPPSAFAATGDSAEEAQRQVDSMQTQQMLLLAQIDQQLAALPVPDPRATADLGAAQAQEEKRRQLLDLMAEIERQVRADSARPRKRYISPTTQEAAYAGYVAALRRRIEARGTAQFPQAEGRKLYGELTMVLTINFDGTVARTQVQESSGDAALDRRAEAIVRSVGNFGPFTDAMRRQTDQIVLPSRFRFTRDQTTELSSG